MHRKHLLDLKINFHKIILCKYFTNLDFLSIFFGSHDFPDLEIGTRLIQDFGFQTGSIVFMRARRTNLEIGLKCSCTFHLYFEKKLLTDRQKYKTDPKEEMNEVSKFSDSFMNTE